MEMEKWLFISVAFHLLLTLSTTKAAVRLVPPKPAMNPDALKARDYGEWLNRKCPPYFNLVRMKKVVNMRINRQIEKISVNDDLPLAARKAQSDTLQIFMKELNETEIMIRDSFKWMEDVMKGDYSQLTSLKKNSEMRLQALRDATLKEEQEVNLLSKAEEHLVSANKSQLVKGIMDDILREVAEAADQLEEKLDDHVFDNAMHAAEKNPEAAKPNIQAVIKLEDEDAEKPAGKQGNTSESSNEGEKEGGGGEVIKLVDAQDNQFVLSKGSDSTVPHEDMRLIMDLVYLICVCFVFGWLCSVLHLPTMFGYIIGGVVIGPSGCNILKSLVQLETIGEFGVFFILFCVGLEFSPSNLKKVFKVATLGTTLMTGLMIGCGVAVGFLLNSSVNESCFVAACLSLSSTPLVVKFLNPISDEPNDSPSNTDYGTVLLGILIMQDVLLGLLMALLPNMAAPAGGENTQSLLYTYSWVFLKLFAALAVVLVASLVASKVVISRVYRYLIRKGNNEITVLATVVLAFTMMMVTNYLRISMELGCFLAGVMVSAQGHKVVEHTEHLISPVRDFLACVFFASIGLHVFPTFLVYELTILTTFTMATIGAKYAISVLVLYLLVPKKLAHIKWIVAAGLAQVSEFSFVLGSRARQLGLISREVYLLILSITTCSLICAPVLWKATLYQLNVKTHSQKTSPSNGPEESHLEDVVLDINKDGLTSSDAKLTAQQRAKHRRISND